MEFLDKLVNEIISEFPYHSIPDELSFLENGDQYKAPDHSIFNGRVLVERKSRNAKSEPEITAKVFSISEKQGKKFRAFGQFSVESIFRQLPDPDGARKQFVDFLTAKTAKFIRDANRKFRSYRQINTTLHCASVLIVTDSSDFEIDMAIQEQFSGRVMGGYAPGENRCPHVDCVILVKNPAGVFQGQNQYWFKCILRSDVFPFHRPLLDTLVYHLHERISDVLSYRFSRFVGDTRKVRKLML